MHTFLGTWSSPRFERACTPWEATTCVACPKVLSAIELRSRTPPWMGVGAVNLLAVFVACPAPRSEIVASLRWHYPSSTACSFRPACIVALSALAGQPRPYRHSACPCGHAPRSSPYSGHWLTTQPADECQPFGPFDFAVKPAQGLRASHPFPAPQTRHPACRATPAGRQLAV